MAIDIGRLHEIFVGFETSPFLFVGSGISRRYLGTHNWEGLLESIANDVRENKFGYASYKNNCIVSQDDDLFLPQIATDIEKDYNREWYESQAKKWQDRRDLFIGEGMQRDESPFKYHVSSLCRNRIIDDDQKHEELDLLRKLATKHVSAVITTNYDCLMEEVFSDFQPFVGQDDMIFSSTQGIGEIYKIHGCCRNPSSIVINRSDYEAFHARSVYLAAKLLTTFVERPIVFIGYGLGDQNIKTILNSIVGGVSRHHVEKLEKRLIYVNYVKDPSLERITSATKEYKNGTLPMTQIDLCDYRPLYREMETSKFKISTKYLKHIKETVSELVLTSTPTSTTKVININDKTNIESVEFVVGVGVINELAKTGIIGLKSSQIYLDILNDSLCERIGFDVDYFLHECMPNMLACAPLPVWKYMSRSKSGGKFHKRVSKMMKESSNIDSFRTSTINRNINYGSGKTGVWRRNKYTIPMLRKELGAAAKCIPHILKLEDDLIRKEELFDFLIEVLQEEPEILDRQCSEFKKLIRLYDFLAYQK